MSKEIIPLERIARLIFVLREQKVMLDFALAALYGVPTGHLNRAVKRNVDRFPSDFMFQLKPEELANLKCQIGISSWGGRRALPYAFTEHGTVMLASVLNSPIAIQASIAIVQAFVRLRQMLASHVELARKLSALEKKYDAQFKVVFDAIRQLMEPPPPKRRHIGFHTEEKKEH